MTRLLDAMLRQAISQNNIHILETRMNGFIYPRTWDRFSTKMILLKGRKMKSMELARKLALISSYLFQGLVDPALLQPLYGLLSLRGQIMNKHHTDATIVETQQAGERWVVVALSYTNNIRNFSLDLPNTHLLIELLVRFLPMVRDLHSGMTGIFESKHQLHKEIIQNVKCIQTVTPENYALYRSQIMQAFMFIASSGRWGSQLQFEAGPELKSLLNRQSI